MIIDGKAIAAEVLARAKARAEKLPRKPKVLFYAPTQTPATQSYLKIKTKSADAAGCAFEETKEPTFDGADAAIVQLPLPEGMDVRETCNRIPLTKDADVLSDAARAAFMRGDERAPLPPVVGALAEVLARSMVDARGKKAVVVGSGYLVGQPCAAWLAQEGARVTTVNQTKGDLTSALHDADIVVLGAGSPHLVKPEMLKEGVVLFDAGTSESDGVTVGDADPACAPMCSVFTPVPGGVGPIAVAKLFENAISLTERNLSF